MILFQEHRGAVWQMNFTFAHPCFTTNRCCYRKAAVSSALLGQRKHLGTDLDFYGRLFKFGFASQSNSAHKRLCWHGWKWAAQGVGETFSFSSLENHGLSALLLALHHSLKPRTSPLPLQTSRFQFEDKATQTLVNLPEYAAQKKPGLENGASKATRTTNPSVLNPKQTQTVRAPHLTAFRSSLDLLGNAPQLLGSTWEQQDLAQGDQTGQKRVLRLLLAPLGISAAHFGQRSYPKAAMALQLEFSADFSPCSPKLQTLSGNGERCGSCWSNLLRTRG